MYSEEKVMAHERQSKNSDKPASDKEPTELTMFIGKAYENNANIRNEINELQKHFSRFSDLANTLNPDKFYKNRPIPGEPDGNKNTQEPKGNSGLVGKLDDLLDSQKSIEVSLAEFCAEVREHALFFEKHI